MRKQELQLSFLDPESDYYNIEQQQQSEVLEDDLEYQVKNVYLLPREATWEYLRENAEQDDIKVKVDQAFVLLDELLAKRNPDYKGVLEPIFVKSQLSPTQVAGLINLFSKEKFSEINNPESDIYGHVYEYYIGKFAMAEGSGAGQFFTPGSVVRLLVEMLEPLKGRIMDLACGSGGMFVQSLKFLQAHGGDKIALIQVDAVEQGGELFFELLHLGAGRLVSEISFVQRLFRLKNGVQHSAWSVF